MPARPSYMPTSHAQAERLVLSARDKNSKKIGNNTYVEALGGGDYGVRYHGTYIVRFFADGTVTLHTGGYRTATTKTRLHEVAMAYGWRLTQTKYVWIMHSEAQGSTGEFFDGFVVSRSLVSA